MFDEHCRPLLTPYAGAFFSLISQILRKLKHENIIEMLDAFESPQEFCVVTEFAQVGLPFLVCEVLLLFILIASQLHMQEVAIAMLDVFEFPMHRENYLRYLRMISVFLKNKFKQ